MPQDGRSGATGRRAPAVALLAPCFWPEVRRGGERLAADLGAGLAGRGHPVRLITSHPGPPSRRREHGMEVIRNWRPPAGRLRRRRFEDHLTHVPLSYLTLRRGDDDVAHALYPTDALAAVRWAERTGRPAVLTYLGVPDRADLAARRLRAEITHSAMRRCDAVVAISAAAAAAIERWLGVQTRTIHPGVDLDAFAPGGERASRPTIFCPAAADEPRKRVPLLLEAFERLRRQVPEARLVLSDRGGDAVPAEQLRNGSVELASVDDRVALVECYRAAWVSVLPSHAEAFGLVLVESLACGTPVVGSRDGGVPEIVDRPDAGRLFEGGAPEPLARALAETLELAADPATVAACRARAERFSLDDSVAAYERLYAELLEARGA